MSDINNAVTQTLFTLATSQAGRQSASPLTGSSLTLSGCRCLSLCLCLYYLEMFVQQRGEEGRREATMFVRGMMIRNINKIFVLDTRTSTFFSFFLQRLVSALTS